MVITKQQKVEFPSLQRTATMRTFCLALALLAVLTLGATLSQAAYASTSLRVGDYVALAGVPNSAEYDDNLISLKAKSSNSSVVSCSAKKPEGYGGKRELFAYARGFGEASITVSWTLRESTYNEKTGKAAQATKKYSKAFDYSVKEASVKKACCDHLFTGKDYSLSDLFKGVRASTRLSYFSGQSKDTFIAGKGYSVSANGKKVRFEQQGSDLTVGFGHNGKAYPIYIAAVHSQDSLSNKVMTAVKKLCYYPSSLKVKSVSLRNSKLYMSFSAVNLAGVRNNSRVCAYFDHGVFRFEKLS